MENPANDEALGRPATRPHSTRELFDTDDVTTPPSENPHSESTSSAKAEARAQPAVDAPDSSVLTDPFKVEVSELGEGLREALSGPSTESRLPKPDGTAEPRDPQDPEAGHEGPKSRVSADNVLEDAREQELETLSAEQSATQGPPGARPVNPSDLEPDPTPEFEIPEGLRRRFLVAANRYHFRDPQQTLAFEDRGRDLVTPHDSPDVAKSMVELAAAKGWTILRVRGTEEFRRAAWREASLRGLALRGFDPEPVDEQRLAELRVERERWQARQEQPEDSRPRTQREEMQPAAAKPPADERGLTPNQSTAIEALRAVLEERGDSPDQISAAVSVAMERFNNRRAYVGSVLEHGAAPYDFNDENGQSYFVRLRTGQGERVVWGVDLARAIQEGNISPGDEIALAFQGKQPVTVKVKQRDQQGHVVGMTEITTNRNQWAAEKVESLRAEALAAIARTATSTGKQPRVRTYDPAVRGRGDPPAPHELDRSRSAQRSR